MVLAISFTFLNPDGPHYECCTQVTNLCLCNPTNSLLNRLQQPTCVNTQIPPSKAVTSKQFIMYMKSHIINSVFVQALFLNDLAFSIDSFNIYFARPTSRKSNLT